MGDCVTRTLLLAAAIYLSIALVTGAVGAVAGAENMRIAVRTFRTEDRRAPLSRSKLGYRAARLSPVWPALVFLLARHWARRARRPAGAVR